ncbi:hypothetical protein PRNP1_003751 [Phytophthora ramorum]
MRACYILLLPAVILLASFGATPVSGQAILASGASPDTPESIETTRANGNSRRALRNHWTDNIDDRNAGESDNEDRGISGTAKILKRLKNWADKDTKLMKMLSGGAVDDLALFAELYTRKADPYRMFTKMNLSKLSVAEKKTDEVYLKWAAYFDYWVDRNAGKIKA